MTDDQGKGRRTYLYICAVWLKEGIAFWGQRIGDTTHLPSLIIIKPSSNGGMAAFPCKKPQELGRGH